MTEGNIGGRVTRPPNQGQVARGRIKHLVYQKTTRERKQNEKRIICSI